MEQNPANNLNAKFRLHLQNEFSRRIRTNGRYSLRSFARNLKIDPSTLSQILKGTRRLSDHKIQQLCAQAGINFDYFDCNDDSFIQIKSDAFSLLADWYHFAILELSLTIGFKDDPKWIGHKLGISMQEASMALERLQRLGFLQQVDGVLVKSKPFYTTDGETSGAHKEYQRQVIQKALQAVDQCDSERKDITSITIAADVSKLPLARKMIKKFRRNLCETLEADNKNSVYHLTIQLYPVTNLQ